MKKSYRLAALAFSALLLAGCSSVLATHKGRESKSSSIRHRFTSSTFGWIHVSKSMAEK
mgnify:CR=1 FL=1